MKDHKEAVNNIMENIKNEMLWRLENEYQRGYEEGKKAVNEQAEKITYADIDEAYQRGLGDAWKCARKIVLSEYHGGIPRKQFDEIFDERQGALVLKKLTVQEVMQKIKDYEERQTEKSCENCFFYGHCKYYGKTLTWLLGDKNEQTGEKVCKSWKPNK